MCLYKCGKTVTLKKDLKVWAARIFRYGHEDDEISPFHRRLINPDNYNTKRYWSKADEKSFIEKSECGKSYKADWHFFRRKKAAEVFKCYVMNYLTRGSRRVDKTIFEGVTVYDYIIPADTRVQYGYQEAILYMNQVIALPVVVSSIFINPRVKEKEVQEK